VVAFGSAIVSNSMDTRRCAWRFWCNNIHHAFQSSEKRGCIGCVQPFPSDQNLHGFAFRSSPSPCAGNARESFGMGSPVRHQWDGIRQFSRMKLYLMPLLRWRNTSVSCFVSCVFMYGFPPFFLEPAHDHNCAGPLILDFLCEQPVCHIGAFS